MQQRKQYHKRIHQKKTNTQPKVETSLEDDSFGKY